MTPFAQLVVAITINALAMAKHATLVVDGDLDVTAGSETGGLTGTIDVCGVLDWLVMTCRTSVSAPLRSGARLGRCAAETAAEGAVEVGQIAEADRKRDRAHGARGIGEQHVVGAGKPRGEYEFGERLALGRKQELHVTGRDAQMGRHNVGAQIVPMQVLARQRLGGE